MTNGLAIPELRLWSVESESEAGKELNFAIQVLDHKIPRFWSEEPTTLLWMLENLS